MPNTEYKGATSDIDKIEVVIFEGNAIVGELKIDDQSLDLK